MIKWGRQRSLKWGTLAQKRATAREASPRCSVQLLHPLLFGSEILQQQFLTSFKAQEMDGENVGIRPRVVSCLFLKELGIFYLNFCAGFHTQHAITLALPNIYRDERDRWKLSRGVYFSHDRNEKKHMPFFP